MGDTTGWAVCLRLVATVAAAEPTLAATEDAEALTPAATCEAAVPIFAVTASDRGDMTDQGMRFMSAISVIVDNLDDPDTLDGEVALLAKGHANLGIRPEWYHVMEEALIDTFRYALGARFTNEMQLAWRSAFGQICEAMKADENA